MAQCLNCKANIGCGCNKRVASDGTSCCNNCLAAYESRIRGTQTGTNTTTQKIPPPRINSVFSRRLKQ
jgi:hypothetical protein